MEAAGSERLVFLCGFPSSGTDLLKNVLNAHPEVRISGEAPFLPGLARRFEASLSASQAAAFAEALQETDVYGTLDATAASALGGEAGPSTATAVYARMLGGAPVTWKGNKTPQNTENVDALVHLFPAARFVLIVRDPRDVALSWQRKWGRDKLLCAAKWQERMERGRAALERLPRDRVLTLRYEDLLADLAGAASRLCELLGLAFDPGMLEFHRSVAEPMEGKLNYGRELLADNTGKWRAALGRREVERIEEITFATAQRWGYVPSRARAARPITTFERLRGRLRDAWALVFVGNRALPRGRRTRYKLRAIGVELRKRWLRLAGGRGGLS